MPRGTTSGGMAPGGKLAAFSGELRVDGESGAVGVGADHEAHDDHAARGLRGGVDVLDVRDLEQRLLERRHQAALDLLGGRSGQPEEDVDHRDLDLRLLLARRHQDGEGAEEERGDDEERRQLRVEKGGGDATGETRSGLRLRSAHGWASESARSAGRAIGVTRIDAGSRRRGDGEAEGDRLSAGQSPRGSRRWGRPGSDGHHPRLGAPGVVAHHDQVEAAALDERRARNAHGVALPGGEEGAAGGSGRQIERRQVDLDGVAVRDRIGARADFGQASRELSEVRARVDRHGHGHADGEAGRPRDGLGHGDDETASDGGLDQDQRPARRREVADLDQPRGDAAGERRHDARFARHGARGIDRAPGLLHRSGGLLVLHACHVELELRGRLRSGERFEALQIPLGEGQRGLCLGEAALGLGDLPLRGGRIDRQERPGRRRRYRRGRRGRRSPSP